MFDRILALFAFAVFCAFLGVLLWFVPRLDLGLVIVATLILTAFDFFLYKPGTADRK